MLFLTLLGGNVSTNNSDQYMKFCLVIPQYPFFKTPRAKGSFNTLRCLLQVQLSEPKNVGRMVEFSFDIKLLKVDNKINKLLNIWCKHNI